MHVPGLLAAAGVLGGLASSAHAAAAPADVASAQAVFDLALSSAGAATLSAVLRPLLSVGEVAMIVRIVLTWYPDIDPKQLPWSIVVVPTGGWGRGRGGGGGGGRAVLE